MSVVLSAEEFAYLLATVEATAVIGVDDPGLFPDATSRDTVYEAGLESLKVNGHIKPAAKPNEFVFDDWLTQMVATVAHPDFVVFTIRNTEEGRRLILHFLGGPDIVELIANEDGSYTLGLVEDRGGMVMRIEKALALKEPERGKSVEFTVEEPTFESIQDLAEAGEQSRAEAMLRELGVKNGNAESLAAALGSPETNGLVAVVRPTQGQVTAGRKATLFRQANVVWLARRVDATSNMLGVETVGAKTLAQLLDSYLDFLSR